MDRSEHVSEMSTAIDGSKAQDSYNLVHTLRGTQARGPSANDEDVDIAE